MKQIIPKDFTRAQQHLENIQYAEDVFTYSTSVDGVNSFGAISPQNSANAQIQIEADSYFKWVKATFRAWTGSISDGSLSTTVGERPVPTALVEITDSGSGRKLQNTPIPIQSVFGTGSLPYIIPLPRVFLPRSTISFEVTNIAAAGSSDLFVVLELHGLKGFEG